MHLFNSFRKKPLTALEMVEMVTAARPKSPVAENPEILKVSIAVAKVLKCDLFDVIGLRDTDAKIMAIYAEIVMTEMMVTHEIAKKYHINQSYMLHRLREFKDRLKWDSTLQEVMLNINTALKA